MCNAAAGCVVNRTMRRFRLLTALLLLLGTISIASPREAVQAQNGAGARVPKATLVPTSTMRLSGAADSNSPAMWQRQGLPILHVFTSINGVPSLATGTSVAGLGRAQRVRLEPKPAGGNWIEAIVSDEGGTWYGYYHNERVAEFCRGTEKVVPRIGALRSRDRGRTWEDLGIILEAPPLSSDCDTHNEYFVGGVGDFSVMLDHDSRDLYIFFSADRTI